MIVEIRVDDEAVIMGVMADSVHQVIELGAEQIQAAPAFGPRVRVDCLVGMASSNGKFILLLDIDRILATDEVLNAASTALDEPVRPSAEGALHELPAQHGTAGA